MWCDVGGLVRATKMRMDHWKRLLGDCESVSHDVGDDKHADDLAKELFELG